MIKKTYKGKIEKVNKEKHRVKVYVSTPSVDRDKEMIATSAWKKRLKYYVEHPVLLSSHRYDDLRKQIGRATAVGVDDKGLWAEFEYFVNEGNPEADWAFKLAEKGIASYSVGFIPYEWKDGNEEVGYTRKYTDVELVEISQVLVPSNRDAIMSSFNTFDEATREVASMVLKEFFGKEGDSEMETKGVIPYKETPKAPEDYPWDGPKEVKEVDVEDLKVMCAWYDSENPDVKSSYKLPHHRAKDHYVVWRGVATAMAALLGARGGVNIPEKDKKGVYNHLAKHYKQFDREPPELKEYTELELKGLAYEGKILLDSKDTLPVLIHLHFDEKDLKGDIEKILKEGRVLSEKNRTLVKETIESLKKSVQMLEDLLKASEPPVKEDSKSKEITFEEFLKNLIKEVN